jgi:hypothetical protein
MRKHLLSGFMIVGLLVVAADYQFADDQPTSLAVDFAPTARDHDLDRPPRDLGVAQLPEYQGPRGTGANARQFLCAADTIYCNSFDPY